MVAPTESTGLARAAIEFYETDLRKTLEATHPNEFVAIEPQSRTYFFGRTLSEAIQAAKRAQPGRLSYAVRVGHRAAVEIGLMFGHELNVNYRTLDVTLE